MAPKYKSRSTSRKRGAAVTSPGQAPLQALSIRRPEAGVPEHPLPRHRRPADSAEPAPEAEAVDAERPKARREGPPAYTGPRPDTELVHAVSAVVEPLAGGATGPGEAVEFIYEMIQSGEDVNQHSVGGFTPLAVAAAAGDDPLVSLLLEKRADAGFACLDRRELPLHLAARRGHRVVCTLLAAPTREAGALDAATSNGWTPLHLAAEAGHADVLRVLLRARADVARENVVHGRVTSAHLAAQSAHGDALEDLLDASASPTAADASGLTPLHVAASRHDDRCVALLLRHRADPSLRGGARSLTAMEMVPAETAGRFVRMLSAYTRRVSPRRTDARFDLATPPRGPIISAAAARVGTCEVLADDAPAPTDVWL